MCRLEYIKLDQIDPNALLPLLNKPSTREHLVDHEIFDTEKVTLWVQSKIDVDATKGCRVRAIMANKQLAGWCGIQFEDGNYEIAIVIEDNYWGIGIAVFYELMDWAKEFGHPTIFIHLLSSRPEYKFLQKISKKVYKNEMMGSKFLTYELDVNE
ncbi:MAG: N-acetyltransferase [Agarilytica sp.]